MQLPSYLVMLRSAERALAEAYRSIGGGHAEEADVAFTCAAFARRCDEHADALTPIVDRYERADDAVADRLDPLPLQAPRIGPLGLLRDLGDLLQLATFVESTWTLVGQAAHGARDRDLIAVAGDSAGELGSQLAWIRMR